MNSSKQIKLGALISYFAIAFNILAGLIYTPWMVGQIGKSDYGLYTLANSLITLFLVDFGLGQAVSRYVSKYRAEGDEEKVNNFLGLVYKLYLIIDAVIFAVLVVVFFLIDAIYVKLTPAELEKFKIVYIISASYAVFNFPFVTLNGILTSYERFVPLKLADLMTKVVTIGLTVAALFMGWGLYALVAVHAIAGLLTVALKYVCVKSATKIKVNFKYSDKALFKDVFGFSIWVTVSLLAQRLIFNITPSILGVVANSAAIAVFGIITVIEGYVYTITSAINGMFLPKISRIYASSDSENDLTPLLLGVGKFQYALNGLIVTGFAIVGQLFITLWMGADYMGAYWGILLVTVPGLFYNSLQIANTAMIVEKKVHWQAFITLAAGVINVILSLILSSRFGVLGAAISIFAAYMFRAIATNIVCYKIMKLDIPRFAKECYLRMSVPIIITLAVGAVMNYFVRGGGWMMLIFKGAVISAVYLMTTFFIGLNKNERSRLCGAVKKIIKR